MDPLPGPFPSPTGPGDSPPCQAYFITAFTRRSHAVPFQSALAIAISFVGDLDKLVGYVMFGFWAQRIFTLIALLTIRYKCIPVHPEAIRIPLPW